MAEREEPSRSRQVKIKRRAATVLVPMILSELACKRISDALRVHFVIAVWSAKEAECTRIRQAWENYKTKTKKRSLAFSPRMHSQ
jgi:hypothetical protein